MKNVMEKFHLSTLCCSKSKGEEQKEQKKVEHITNCV